MVSVTAECNKLAHYAECRHAKCRYAECHGAKIWTQNFQKKLIKLLFCVQFINLNSNLDCLLDTSMLAGNLPTCLTHLGPLWNLSIDITQFHFSLIFVSKVEKYRAQN